MKGRETRVTLWGSRSAYNRLIYGTAAKTYKCGHISENGNDTMALKMIKIQPHVSVTY